MRGQHDTTACDRRPLRVRTAPWHPPSESRTAQRCPTKFSARKSGLWLVGADMAVRTGGGLQMLRLRIEPAGGIFSTCPLASSGRRQPPIIPVRLDASAPSTHRGVCHRVQATAPSLPP